MLSELHRRFSLVTGACVLGMALGLKAFYSRAGASELLWVLAPSAWLARWVGGIDLVYEQGAGYISHAHHLVVGAACAGINFLVICFLCFYFSFAPRLSSKVRWLCWSLLIAFAATVAANAVRIVVSAHLWDAEIYREWVTQEQMHRLAGIVIYYTSLLALYFAVDARFGGGSPSSAPLLWYVGVSLGAPLAGRMISSGTPGFVGHAAWVMSVVVALTVVLPSLLRNRIHLRP